MDTTWKLKHRHFSCDLIENRILLLSRYLSFVLLSDSRPLADAIHLGAKPSSQRSLSPVGRKHLSHWQNPFLCVLLSFFFLNGKTSHPSDLCDCGPTAGTDLRLTELYWPEPTKTAHSNQKSIGKGGTLQQWCWLCCSDSRRVTVVWTQEVVDDIEHLLTMPNLISGDADRMRVAICIR